MLFKIVWWFCYLCIIIKSSSFSGKWEPLWLCKASQYAYLHKYGRLKRADSCTTLWVVQTLQTGRDGLQGHWPSEQTSQVKDFMCSTCFQHPFTSHLTVSTQYRAGFIHRIGFLRGKELFVVVFFFKSELVWSCSFSYLHRGVCGIVWALLSKAYKLVLFPKSFSFRINLGIFIFVMENVNFLQVHAFYAF